MLKPVYLIAFSGHRPDGTSGRTNEAIEATAPRLRQALEGLRSKAEAVGGEVHLISGVAAGADIVACEVARDLAIPLHVILPRPEELFLQSFKDDLANWKPRAIALLDTARSSKNGPPSQPRNTFRVGALSHHSPDCYAEANTRMLEVADLLLTVCTGEPSKSIAGTEQLIEEASARSLPQINVNPARPEKPPEGRFTESFAQGDSTGLAVFGQLKPHVSPDLTNAPSPSGSLASSLSKAAIKSSTSFRRGTAIAITLHALAGFIAAGAASCYFALHDKSMDEHVTYKILAGLALIELILVGAAFVLEIRAKKARLQHTWLNCRFARELMRGIEAATLFQDPLFPDVSRHDPQWGRFAITCALQIHAEIGPLDAAHQEAIVNARNAYITRRVDDQIKHFREKARDAQLTSIIFNKLAHYAGPVALVVVLLAFLAKSDDLLFEGHHKPGFLENLWIAAVLLLFLPIFVPLLASLTSSFIAAFDFGRRSVRYHEMVTALITASQKLKTHHALRNIQTTIHHTEQILLHEQIEWLTAQKSGFGH